MSWADDEGLDCVDEEFLESLPYWENLQRDGYVWIDRQGRRYTEEEIDNDYLLKILNFCKRNYRPKEQVQTLKELAIKRGLIGDER
jgi:hypothetical protein